MILPRYCFTGSRRWTDPAPVEAWFRRLRRGVVVHGDAPGLDTMAGELARKHGWPVEPHPAAWQEHAEGWCWCSPEEKASRNYCEGAGYRRNEEIAESGITAGFAFPLIANQRSGTMDMVRRLRSRGVVVEVHGERGVTGDLFAQIPTRPR